MLSNTLMFPLAYDGERIIKYIDKHAVTHNTLSAVIPFLVTEWKVRGRINYFLYLVYILQCFFRKLSKSIDQYVT